MRRFTKMVSVQMVCVMLCFGLVGCAGFKLHITPTKTELESIPGGKNKLVVEHPDGSSILVEVNLIGSIADTVGALVTVVENPVLWIVGLFLPPSDP